ncbi:MAG: hypothetical protein ABWW70_07555 [Thermoproteota archaeon]
MVLRLRAEMATVPSQVVEEAMDIHPAIDPETGHPVCHYLSVSAAVLDTGGHPVPAVLVGSCVALVSGREHVARVLEAGGASPAGLELRDRVGVGGVEVDPELAYTLFSVLRLARSGAQLYTLELEDAGASRRVPAARLRLEDGQEVLVVLLRPCGGQERRPSSSIYF